MKPLSFFLLLSGWGVVLAAVAMLASPPARIAFVLAGTAVELLGLVLLFRCHLVPRRD
ncbi:MAG TPA: hypothetical protein VNJ52_01800 [Patescibacteria group bacterium]|nr:hypothetical protein [Patescibacteria group bacterium]